MSDLFLVPRLAPGRAKLEESGLLTWVKDSFPAHSCLTTGGRASTGYLVAVELGSGFTAGSWHSWCI